MIASKTVPIFEKNGFILSPKLWTSPNEETHQQQFEYKLEKSAATTYREHLSKAECLIPRWLTAVLAFVFIFLVVCLAASLSLLLVKPTFQVFGKSCRFRQCLPNLGLKCLADNICSCSPLEHYTNRCVSLSNYGESCFESNECLRGLVCTNAICECDENQFWNGKSCQQRSGFNSNCSFDDKQCLNNLNLICEPKNKKCVCQDSMRYTWNDTLCTLKKSIGGECESTSDCLDIESLSCINAKCNCTSALYWNGATSRCEQQKAEFDSCSDDRECMQPMFCSLNTRQCQCRHFYFHEAATVASNKLQCTPKYLIDVACNVTSQCRLDLGLKCSSYTCACSTPTPIWSHDDAMCMATLGYGKSCSNGLDCDRTRNLACVMTSNVTKKMCGCELIVGHETFWNGSKCVEARNYSETCSSNLECQTMTQKTYCDGSGICSCKQPGGFSSNSQSCLTCQSGHVFFLDVCYYISTNSSKRDEAQTHCAQLGGNLARAESIEQVRFFSANLLNDYYWLSGRRRNSAYYWLPSATSLASNRTCPDFNSGTTDNYDYECLYFDSKPTTECFRATNCNNLYRYVCEIK